MNQCEKQMLDILTLLRQEYGAIAVKAEFEAEGTRTDELLRLIDLARRADLKIGLKIGGCEAVRDMIESKQFGVEYIIAPMVETPYALKKFIEAKNKVYTPEQQGYTDFLFNLETVTTFNALTDILDIATSPNGLQGVVFGRVDFAASLNLNRAAIETDIVMSSVIATAQACEKKQLELVVGGAISLDSLPNLKTIRNHHLTRFETRKVIFSAAALDHSAFENGLKETIHFELLWLLNKRDYYQAIQEEDLGRINMLTQRWQSLKNI